MTFTSKHCAAATHVIVFFKSKRTRKSRVIVTCMPMALPREQASQTKIQLLCQLQLLVNVNYIACQLTKPLESDQ